MKDQKRKHFGNVFIKYGVGGGGWRTKIKQAYITASWIFT